MFTYLHKKQYSHASHDVAHLYEHMFIQSFYERLIRQGISPGTIGYVNGETFNGLIFFEAMFYDERVAKLYEGHIATHGDFLNGRLIAACVMELEVEDCVRLDLHKEDELQAQLSSLFATPCTEDVAGVARLDKVILPRSPFISTKAAKDFKEVHIGVGTQLSDLVLKEQAVFLRLAVLIEDSIAIALGREFHARLLQNNPVTAKDGLIGLTMSLRMPSDANLKTAQKLASDAVRDISRSPQAIKLFFEEFSMQGLWKAAAIEYFRNAGILTTNELIADAATPVRVRSILSKLKVQMVD